MMALLCLVLGVLSGILTNAWAQFVNEPITPNQLFDYDLYERVIDTEQCRLQMAYIQFLDPMLLIQFTEAGIRFPRGITLLNTVDLGNYDQCLAINSEVANMKIEGKYCFIGIPLEQTLELPIFDNLPESDFSNGTVGRFHNDLISTAQRFYVPERGVGRDLVSDMLTSVDLKFGICIPKACSSQEWIRSVLFNVSALGFTVTEEFCRLPNDKPLVGADYAAIVIFSVLGFVTLLSTTYDVNHVIIKKRDPKKAKVLYRTFSVYTNTKRLLTFNPNSNALLCLDGIRSISMMWVIVGHTFPVHNFNANLADIVMWLTTGEAVWVTTGIFSVDSFLLMAGLLLVYTTVGKMTGKQLLQRLHLFYINRILRLFPLLATLVLLEASVYHRIADGPYWEEMGAIVQNCRVYWWSTLLYIQNYVNPDYMCIQHSWYLAIDMQLHILSPIVLYWVLGKNKRVAWIALISALLAIVVGSTVWNFIQELPSTSASILRVGEQAHYMNNYYVLVWCRGGPFFVGMIVGYILNMCKGKNLKLNMGFVITSWIIALAMLGSCFYMSYVIMQLDWDNQVGDSMFNSFMRVVWAIGLGWVIFACSMGYGGPINWFLSLSVWKLPARISFAMYLYHFGICFLFAGSQRSPVFFSVSGRIYDFFAIFCLSFILSFAVTLLVDSPFSILIKLLMGGGGKRKPREQTANGNSSKPDLEQTITTLDESRPTNGHYLEKNGSPMEGNSHYKEKKGSPMEGNSHYQEKNGLPMEGNGHYPEKNGSSMEKNGHYPEK